LLTAAYVLQEHNQRLPGKESQNSRPDPTQSMAEIVETQKLIQANQLDLHAAAALIAERAQRITHASGATVGLVEDGQLAYCAAIGSAASEAGLRIPLDSCLSAECWRTEAILQCPRAEKDSRLNLALCRKRKVKSLIAVPVFHVGKIAGIFELRFAK